MKPNTPCARFEVAHLCGPAGTVTARRLKSASSRTARRAFTLTEVLVVCIIIGILMSLVANAVFSAIGTAKEAAISNEIDKMRIAMEQLKTEYRSLPPADLRNPDDPGSPIYKFFAAAFQNYNASRLQADLEAEGINYTQFDPGYALAFWLVGFHPDSSNPLRGHGRRMGWDPEWTGGAGTAELEADLSRAYYEFERERLIRGHYFPPFTKGDPERYYSHDDDGNGIWDAGEDFDGHNAYLYFDSSSSYKGLLDCDPSASGSDNEDKCAYYLDFQPYRKLALSEVPTGLPTDTGFSKLRADRDPHYNNDTYQIVSAGLDEKLGTGGRRPAKGEPYSGADADNITNFSEGTVGDFTDR